jgi:hypothetical protein
MTSMLLFTLMLAGADTEPALEALKTAKEAHAFAVEKARSALLADFDRKLKEIRDSDSIKADAKVRLIDDLKKAKAAFEATSELPGLPPSGQDD